MGQQTISATIPCHFIHALHKHRHMARYTLAGLLCQFSRCGPQFSHTSITVYARIFRLSNTPARHEASWPNELPAGQQQPLRSKRGNPGGNRTHEGATLNAHAHCLMATWLWRGFEAAIREHCHRRSQYLQFATGRRRISTPLRLSFNCQISWESLRENTPRMESLGEGEKVLERKFLTTEAAPHGANGDS